MTGNPFALQTTIIGDKRTKRLVGVYSMGSCHSLSTNRNSTKTIPRKHKRGHSIETLEEFLHSWSELRSHWKNMFVVWLTTFVSTKLQTMQERQWKWQSWDWIAGACWRTRRWNWNHHRFGLGGGWLCPGFWSESWRLYFYRVFGPTKANRWWQIVIREGRRVERQYRMPVLR